MRLSLLITRFFLQLDTRSKCVRAFNALIGLFLDTVEKPFRA
jgi:hypothetical protein